jgi:transcriptional regulator with XRE-family HTH domain
MTGAELKAIRHRLGLSTRELGAAFGYRGNANTLSVAIRLYESGKRPIPPWIGRLATMFERHGVPPDWTIPVFHSEFVSD